MTDPVDFIPAGCCCEASKNWLGRRASTAPLPASFIKAAVAGGSLVPPHTGAEIAWPRVLAWLAFLGLVCSGVVWIVLNFTRV